MEPITRMAAYAYLALTVLVVAFQTALLFGAPWGAYTMGGGNPGRLPAPARAAVAVQAALLVFFGCVVVARAGIALTGFAGPSQWLAWLAVVVLSLSLIGNLLSPSRGERLIWVPVLTVMLISIVLIAADRASR